MSDARQTFDAKAILERAKYLLRVTSDRELADAAGIEYQTLISWKKRNSIPLQAIIELAGKAGCLLDYLVFGERFVDPVGSPPKIDSAVMEIAIRMVCRAASIDDALIPKIVREATLYYIVLANMMDSLIRAGTERNDALRSIEKTSVDIEVALEDRFRAA